MDRWCGRHKRWNAGNWWPSGVGARRKPGWPGYLFQHWGINGWRPMGSIRAELIPPSHGQAMPAAVPTAFCGLLHDLFLDGPRTWLPDALFRTSDGQRAHGADPSIRVERAAPRYAPLALSRGTLQHIFQLMGAASRASYRTIRSRTGSFGSENSSTESRAWSFDPEVNAMNDLWYGTMHISRSTLVGIAGSIYMALVEISEEHRIVPGHTAKASLMPSAHQASRQSARLFSHFGERVASSPWRACIR